MTPAAYSTRAFQDAVEYITGVLDGSIIVGRLVRLAVERHVDDLGQGTVRGFTFDPDRVERVFRFFSLLRHWKGRFAGKQFVLSPWQAFILLALFGWVDGDGKRRFRKCYIQIARKNGKTTFAAGIALYALAADREAGAEVYSAATKLDQARICHECAIKMRAASPALRSRIKLYKDNLSIDRTDSVFKPLGADHNTQDGLNPHVSVIDELHKHRTRGTWDVLVTARGSREQPLVVTVTTSGYDLDSICWEQRDYSEKTLERTITDDRYFAFVAELDKDDTWTDERCWIKGNPNLGVSKTMEYLRDECVVAANSPASQNAFRRLELNQWTEQNERWLDMQDWAACPGVLPALSGRLCFGGLDLASTQDVAAFVLVFPPPASDPHDKTWHLICRFWVPKENIKNQTGRNIELYRQWVGSGDLIATDGDVIDYDVIRAEITALADRYDLIEVGFDPWNSTQLMTQLIGDGVIMVPMRQGYPTLSAPTKHLGNLVKSGTLNHGGQPVLRWMASNTFVISSTNADIRPVKAMGKRAFKIDGIVAAILGCGRALVNPSPYSAYENRGIGVA